MARARLTNPPQDIIQDEGSVLLSFVKGEQLEFPIPMEFFLDATGYTFEAVVIEADNVASQTTAPSVVKANGVQTVLNVRLPVIKGAWLQGTVYYQEDIVYSENKWWRLRPNELTSNTEPSLDTRWAETFLNIIYVQFPATLASTWAQPPVIGSPVYGFFEIRVTEPNNAIFVRTWKPIRGMVEILFSPTDVVTD